MAYSNGYLYGVGGDHAVYRTVPNSLTWTKFIDGFVTKIIIHEDFIYGIGTDNDVYKTSATPGGFWTMVAIPYVTDLGMITI